MQDPKEIERARILTDLTDLAQSLVIGGLKKDQPDILLVGKTLLAAIGAVANPESAKLLQDLLAEYSAREHKGEKEEREIKDLLSSLGISLN
jgi:hypothetical protein